MNECAQERNEGGNVRRFERFNLFEKAVFPFFSPLRVVFNWMQLDR